MSDWKRYRESIENDGVGGCLLVDADCVLGIINTAEKLESSLAQAREEIERLKNMNITTGPEVVCSIHHVKMESDKHGPHGYFCFKCFAEHDTNIQMKWQEKEVKELEAQRDRYREALEKIVVDDKHNCGVPCDCINWAKLVSIAKQALEGGKQ